MPIFRVQGKDRDNRLTSLDINCANESTARNLAIERGFRNTLSVEIIEGHIDPAAVVRPAERINDRSARRPIADPLRERPIRTIALGVLVGMLLWTALWLLLGLLFDLIGLALPRP